MSVDKSATQRAELDRRIERVEQQEEEFSQVRDHYERSLEQFREQFHAVGRDREWALQERVGAGDTGAQQELEARQELLSKLDRYVHETAEEVEDLRRQIRQSFDDDLEKLATERNELPWE